MSPVVCFQRACECGLEFSVRAQRPRLSLHRKRILRFAKSFKVRRHDRPRISVSEVRGFHQHHRFPASPFHSLVRRVRRCVVQQLFLAQRHAEAPKRLADLFLTGPPLLFSNEGLQLFLNVQRRGMYFHTRLAHVRFRLSFALFPIHRFFPAACIRLLRVTRAHARRSVGALPRGN